MQHEGVLICGFTGKYWKFIRFNTSLCKVSRSVKITLLTLLDTVGNFLTMLLMTGSRALSEKKDGLESGFPSIWKNKADRQQNCALHLSKTISNTCNTTSQHAKLRFLNTYINMLVSKQDPGGNITTVMVI